MTSKGPVHFIIILFFLSGKKPLLCRQYLVFGVWLSDYSISRSSSGFVPVLLALSDMFRIFSPEDRAYVDTCCKSLPLLHHESIALSESSLVLELTFRTQVQMACTRAPRALHL